MPVPRHHRVGLNSRTEAFPTLRKRRSTSSRTSSSATLTPRIPRTTSWPTRACSSMTLMTTRSLRLSRKVPGRHLRRGGARERRWTSSRAAWKTPPRSRPATAPPSGGGGGGGWVGGTGGGPGECGGNGRSYPVEGVEGDAQQVEGGLTITFIPPVCVDQQGTDKAVFLVCQPEGPEGTEGRLTFTVQRHNDRLKVTSTDGALRTTTMIILPPPYADCRSVVIQTADGEHHLFAVGPPICFQKGTGILTPGGYRPIETLQSGDLLCTRKGALVSIRTLVAFTELDALCPLYCLPTGALGSNCPQTDLYMSGNHAFRAGGKWRHMKCAPEARRVFEEVEGVEGFETVKIDYYHIILPDYFEHTIYAEGVEVETCFKETVHTARMGWICNPDQCLPLKCIPAEF